MLKKLVVLLIGMIVIILITLITINYINTNKERQNELNNNIVIVNENYDKLKISVNTFNDNRVNIYNNVLNKIYFEELENNYNNWNECFNNYEKSVIDMENIINSLDKVCNIEYFDNNVNKKCKNYKKTYEDVVNTFVLDVELYNKQLLEYNNLIESGSIKSNKVELYKSTIK